MDLANSPGLFEARSHAPWGKDGHPAVRMLSVAQAQDPDFVKNWRDLAEHAVEPNPFFEPWFLLPSLKAFANDTAAVTLMTVVDQDRLIGLIPLVRSRDYYRYPIPNISTWRHENIFHGAPLVRKGAENQCWQAMFSHLDCNAGMASFLHLPLLTLDGALDRSLQSVLAETGRAEALVHRHERALLRSDLSSTEYLAQSLSKKHAKELRRQRRRLGETGDLIVSQRDDDYAIGEWVAQFLALEAAGWKGSAGSALACNKSTSTFSSQALRGAAAAGRLNRLTMLLDGNPIAMLANLVTPQGSFAFKTAFDEQFAAFSPGMQLQIEYLKILDRPEFVWSDSCAAQDHPMIDRLWTGRRSMVSRNVAIGGPLRRAAFRTLMAYENRRESQQ